MLAKQIHSMVTGGKTEYVGADVGEEDMVIGWCGSSHLIYQTHFQRIPEYKSLAQSALSGQV